MVNVTIKDANGRTLYLQYLVTAPGSAFHPDEPSIRVGLDPVVMSESDADFLVKEWAKMGENNASITSAV